MDDAANLPPEAVAADPLAAAAESLGAAPADVQTAEAVAGPELTQAAEAVAADVDQTEHDAEAFIAAGKARAKAALGPVLQIIGASPMLSHIAGPLETSLVAAFHEVLHHLVHNGVPSAPAVAEVREPDADELPAG